MLKTFHHGSISRLKAEELLLNAGRDGSFLVRDSETIQGAYTLCVLCQKKVSQYRILPDREGRLSIQAEKGVQERKFVDVVQLIHEYRHRGAKNGLVHALLYPIAPENALEEDDKDTDDDELDAPQTYEPVCGAEKHEKDESENPRGQAVGRFFQQRFQQLDLSGHDGAFIAKFQNYVDEGIPSDYQSVTSGGNKPAHLQKLLSSATQDLARHVDVYKAKVDVIQSLFDYGDTHRHPKEECGPSGAENLNRVVEKLTQCRSSLFALEKQVMNSLKELELNFEEREDYQGVPNIPLRAPSERPVIPPSAFEARLVKHGKPSSKVTLTVDIQAGKLFAVKPSKDVLDESNVFTHDKIQQLVKSTSNNCCLDVRVSGRKKETYMFDDMWHRENFCQLLQQLKNMHNTSREVDHISMFIGTWNMANIQPPCQLGKWLKSQGQGKSRNSSLAMIAHDMYVIGTQESALTEKDWVNKIKASICDTLSEEMHAVDVVSLWGIRLMVLVKKEYKNKISHVRHSTVKTGIANALGNKGAVGISLQFCGTSFCFVCGHLTSGHERCAKRNQNYRDIVKGLSLGPKNLSGIFDLTLQFHHVFFVGDLNYRIDGLDVSEVQQHIQQKSHCYLLSYDQLKSTQEKKEAFYGFSEEEITFPPTYRCEKGSQSKYVCYKHKKTGTRLNVPSWCDRVLWKSYPETYMLNTSYGSVESITTSDHKPVFSSFTVGILGQFVSTHGAKVESGEMQIRFEEISAEVKTSMQQLFKVEFHSSCLENPVLSKANQRFSAPMDDYCRPTWDKTQLSELKPIFSEQEYLEDQHILVALKTADEDESFGECVLALKSMFALHPQHFECPLMHRGEQTGTLRGRMHVRSCSGAMITKRRRARKSYELVYMDTDDLGLDPDPQSQPQASGGITKSLYTESTKRKNEKASNTATSTQDGGSGDRHRWSSQISSESTSSDGNPELPPRNYSSSEPVNAYMSIKGSPRSTSDWPTPEGENQDPPPMPSKPKPKVVGTRSQELDHSSSEPKPVLSGKRSLGAALESGKKSDQGAMRTCGSESSISSTTSDSCSKPGLPPRKPRLGQSSLMQSSVLPIHSRTSNNNAKKFTNAELDHNLNEQLQKAKTAADENLVPFPNGTRFSSAAEEMRINSLYVSSDDISPTPLYENQDLEDQPGIIPPLLPTRGSSLDNREDTSTYDSILPPSSINEWLLNLGLPQYISVFMDSGWDQLEFVSDISPEDLRAMAITDQEHQNRILKSIAEF